MPTDITPAVTAEEAIKLLRNCASILRFARKHDLECSTNWPTEKGFDAIAALIRTQAEQLARCKETLKQYRDEDNWACEENASEYEFANIWRHGHGYEPAQQALAPEQGKEG